MEPRLTITTPLGTVVRSPDGKTFVVTARITAMTADEPKEQLLLEPCQIDLSPMMIGNFEGWFVVRTSEPTQIHPCDDDAFYNEKFGTTPNSFAMGWPSTLH